MFQTTARINRCYYADECDIYLIYGPLGFGKSSYALKVLAELYGSYEKAKEYIVFHPEDFVNRCLSMSAKGQREKAIVWDDAGYWLFYMKHTDPLVQAVEQYFNVARTNWAAIILTTPTPSWVIHKIRYFPQHISIKIIKANSDLRREKKNRIAKAYQQWVAPDFKHSGVRSRYADTFDAMLPKKFYWEWYKPLRDSYAREATENMKRALEQSLKAIGQVPARLATAT